MKTFSDIHILSTRVSLKEVNTIWRSIYVTERNAMVCLTLHDYFLFRGLTHSQSLRLNSQGALADHSLMVLTMLFL